MVAGAIAKDVIFRIGSTGGAATAAKVAAVTAAVALLIKKTADMVNSAERFGQIVRRNNTDMTDFNKATKGLIDTTESYIGANKMQVAGLRLTADQMAAVGRAAISTAQATGQDATAAYIRLTESISKGSSRALRELGIDLENTEDLTLAQQEAIDKLTEKFGSANIEIETSRERFFALNNTIGTLQDQLTLGAIEAFGDAMGDSSNIVGELTQELEELSSNIMETDGALARWMFSQEGVTHGAKLLGNTIADFLIPWTDRFANNIEILNSNFDKTVVKMKTISMAANVLKNVGAQTAQILTFEAENKRMLEMIAKEEKKVDDARRAARTGRTEQETIAQDIFYPAMQEKVDARLAMLEAMAKEEERIEKEKQQEIDKLRKEAEREAERAEKKRLRDAEAAAKAEAQYKKGAMQAGIQALSDLSTFQQVENKKAFNIGKGAAIGEAVIQTGLGAQKAFTALAGIPIVGPALGAAAAGAAIAAGAIRIQSIGSATYEGGGSLPGETGGAGGGTATSVSAAAQNAAVNTGATDDIVDRRPLIVNIGGRTITDTIIEDSIQRQQRGERGLEVRV